MAHRHLKFHMCATELTISTPPIRQRNRTPPPGKGKKSFPAPVPVETGILLVVQARKLGVGGVIPNSALYFTHSPHPVYCQLSSIRPPNSPQRLSHLSSFTVSLLVITPISLFRDHVNNLLICFSASVFTSCASKGPAGGHQLFLKNKYDHVFPLLENSLLGLLLPITLQ